MKRGFTLIELLAVIVILAIIALIAVPIVLNIINDSKESSLLRSAEFYLDAVEYTIADAFLYHGGLEDKKYPIDINGDICKIELDNQGNCPPTGNVSNTLKVEVNGDKPTGGSITINGGNISNVSLVLDEKTIVKNSKGELVYLKYLDDICTLVSGTAKTVGAKYTCEVKEGTSYTFYVLTTPSSTDTSINLIMDQNIYSDGTPAKLDGVTQSTNANKYSLVAWNSSGSNTGGPVDAMQFLYNATKDWTNIDPITYEYKDKEYQGTTVTDTSYTSFVLDDGIATITALDGITTVTIGTKAEPLRVRMPIYAYKNEQEYGEVADKTENNTYLYDNLDDGETAPYCYWTLSSDTDDSSFAWDVVYSGYVSSSLVDFGDGCGARPVINLKI